MISPLFIRELEDTKLDQGMSIADFEIFKVKLSSYNNALKNYTKVYDGMMNLDIVVNTVDQSLVSKGDLLIERKKNLDAIRKVELATSRIGGLEKEINSLRRNLTMASAEYIAEKGSLGYRFVRNEPEITSRFEV